MKFPLSSLIVNSMLLSTLVFPAVAAAQAQMPEPDPTMCKVMRPQEYIPAGLLASMAYRGAFEKEGIPGYILFVNAFNSGKINAEKIVAAAVKGCVLNNASGMAGFSGYINMVDGQVRTMIRESN